MITGNGVPGNNNTNELNLNNGGWVIIGILIAVIVILTVVLCIISYKKQCKIDNLRHYLNKRFTEEELTLIQNYRNLNPQEKADIQNTLKTLSDNPQSPKE